MREESALQIKSNPGRRVAVGRGMLILAMSIFGTIGIFRRLIPLPSGLVALVRATIGAMFLLALILVRQGGFSLATVKKHWLPLLCSGAFLGFNWVLLFEAYKYTSVATATLCYYMAPVLLIFAAPLFLGERLTVKRVLCALTALGGMVLVSGVAEVGFSGLSEWKGMLLGLAAAVLYAAIVTVNKRMTDVPPLDKTLVQFLVSVAVLLPYVLLSEELSFAPLSWQSALLLIAVGVVHTGLAYALYFGAIPRLSAGTVAIYSYIDPILAVVLSAVFLKESMTLYGVIGAVLILASALIGEYRREEKQEDPI